jgi:hypothetical protein
MLRAQGAWKVEVEVKVGSDTKLTILNEYENKQTTFYQDEQPGSCRIQYSAII